MTSPPPRPFDPSCSACPRLAEFLSTGKQKYPSYACKPVPSFGPVGGRLLIVGLAPGWHGANQTGRPFTGDYAGILLYETLYRFGFASAPTSAPGDNLRLIDARLTNAVRCVPPQNKPLPSEVHQCRPFFAWELARAPKDAVVLALGRVAHETILRTLDLRLADHPFAHNAEHTKLTSQGLTLIDSYHCSRYNTSTKRLTEAMFHEVFAHIREHIPA